MDWRGIAIQFLSVVDSHRERASARPGFLAIVVCLVTTTFFSLNVAVAQQPIAVNGETTSQVLTGTVTNKYRGGVDSIQEVKTNMETLFEAIWVDPLKTAKGVIPEPKIDKWFSPHLRDITVNYAQRAYAANMRGRAGAVDAYLALALSWMGYECTGACPWCEWDHPWHSTMACCNVDTSQYSNMVLDNNFKACCVRDGETSWTMEQIACTHQSGDGWAGLFEYYYPATVIGWESQRGTTMIATKQEVKDCLSQSDSMMENKEWVKTAIEKNVKAADDGGGAGVGSASTGSMDSTIAEAIKSLRPADKNLRFSDTLQGGGLTMRANLAHMDGDERLTIARQFCMHPDQFGKLMDPVPDRTQKGGGGSWLELSRLPLWANYCPSAVKLMTDQKETYKVMNLDGTPTNFIMGMATYEEDPLYCQKMNVSSNPLGGEFLKDGVFKNKALATYTEAMVGYTCRTGTSTTSGGFQTRMVPVSLYSSASIDQRTLEHAIPFMIAGGYYFGQMYDGVRSVYKRFEPMPYSQAFGLFKGNAFKPIPFVQNERGEVCRNIDGMDYKDRNQPDQLYLSNKNHSPFSQELTQTFNQYDREWAAPGEGQRDFHGRGLDQSVLNYGAAFRIFATCPKGWSRWRGGDIDNQYSGACGEEHFGGR